DDLRLASHDHHERGHDTSSVGCVKLSAQHDDNVTIAVTGSQIHTEHKECLPASAARRGPDPAANSTSFVPDLTPDTRRCRDGRRQAYPPGRAGGGGEAPATGRAAGSRASARAKVAGGPPSASARRKTPPPGRPPHAGPAPP